MSYANMDGVPTQTEGVSEILASDWNAYVRDNFDSIKSGHIVCTSSTRPTGIQEGTMVYETDTNLIYVYTGSDWKQNNLTPVGMISPFAGSSSPEGWLICDGAAVSRSTYAVLFGLISTTYGIGDGSTTFNVPDLRGRAAIGAGTGPGLSARALAANVGSETHTLDVTQIPNHKHYTSGTTGDDSPDHTHNITLTQDSVLQRGTGVVFDRVRQAGSQTTAGANQRHQHSFGAFSNTSIYNNSNAAQTVNQPHNNIQPSLVLNYIIKA